MSGDPGGAPGRRGGVTPVYLTVFVIASCGLVYELVAGALASYLLGDSVTQFSLVIGVYLSSLGLGAFLSRYVVRGVARRFVDAEIAVALIGGLSAPALFFAFSSPRWFPPVFYGVVVLIGTLVGLEIPLLMRLLKDAVEFRDLVSQVLTFDYLGSLAASLLFPLVLLPRLGLTRTSVLFGLLNVAVAFWSLHLFRDRIGSPAGLYVRAALTGAILVAAFVLADHLTAVAEENQYADEVIVAKSTAYQRIVVTKNRAGFQLFLNGHLQFSSVDEYRYHEALVHPAFAAAGGRGRRVAVLGGGDGLAVREILKHPEVESVTLVDLDPEMTALARTHPLFVDAERRLARVAEGARRERRRDGLDRRGEGPLRRRDRRLPRPEQLRGRQALHVALLRAPRETARPGGRRVGPVHVAALRAPELLDRGRDAEGRRLHDEGVPRRRAVLRRVGLRPRGEEAVRRRAAAPARRACARSRRSSSPRSSSSGPTRARWSPR